MLDGHLEECHDQGVDPIFSAAAAEAAAEMTVAAGPIAISGLPKYHSRPGAAMKLFLDFDGAPAITSWGNYSAPAQATYSQDTDLTTYSDAEQAQILEIWRRVSEKYSPFDIDVTTEDPGNRTAMKTLTVVMASDTGTWLGGTYGGYANIDSFATGTGQSTVYVFPKNLGPYSPKFVAECAAHEAGHALGLRHQSSYDTNGAKLTDYSKGTGTGAGSTAPIMGNSYSAERGLWWRGTTTSATTIQDDLALMTNRISYRIDDHGNTVSSATPLAISGTSVSGYGVIERTTDADVFSFSTGAGTLNITVGSYAYGGMLNLKLDLLTSTGSVVATRNAQTLGETLSVTVGSGAYRLVVSSNGSYGDIGQYSISGTILAPTSLVYAPTNLTASVVSGRVNLAWTDSSSNETGFVVQRSTDGVNFSNLATLGANVTTYSDLGVVAGATYQYRLYGLNGTTASDLSNVVTATLAPVAPASLSATVVSATQIRLNWTDVSGETGFRVERSLDGVNFTQIATVGTGVLTYSDATLNQNTTYIYRVRSSNAGGVSGPSPVASAKTLTAPVPNAPTNLTLTTANKSRLILRWTDNATNETGYRIEQSTNGVTFTQIATVGANATSFTTNRLVAGQMYWYRVSAYNTAGNSAYSNVASLAARGSTAKGEAVTIASPRTEKTKIKLVKLASA